MTPKSPFLDAVMLEAERYQHRASQKADAAMDVDSIDQPSRETLQEELRAAEAAVAALEQCGDAPDIQSALAARKAKRDEAHERLRAARPLRTQLRAAEEARDKACRKHGNLVKEVHSLRLILEGKEQEMKQADTEARQAMASVTVIHEKISNEELQSDKVTTTPLGAVAEEPPPPSMTPVQWAAGLAYTLPAPARASFERWMTYASVAPYEGQEWNFDHIVMGTSDGQSSRGADPEATIIADLAPASSAGPATAPTTAAANSSATAGTPKTPANDGCCRNRSPRPDGQGADSSTDWQSPDMKPFRRRSLRFDPYGGHKPDSGTVAAKQNDHHSLTVPLDDDDLTSEAGDC